MNEKMAVLGAADPEMQEIATLLAMHDLSFCYAGVRGARCHPGNAYVADSTVAVDGMLATRLVEPYDDFIFVECRPKNVPLAEKHTRLTVVDHHEKGDPGYDLGPTNFWEASSLGQVVCWLSTLGKKVDITQEMLVTAAMDHCRQAAVRGECPGVTKEEVLERRMASIVERHKLTLDEVKSSIDGFVAAFKEYKPMPFGSGEVIDFTHRHLGVGYSADYLCAQTALDMIGLAALIRSQESADPSDERIMLTGHATPAMVQYFIDDYARASQLTRVFGVPQRGYAGGYVPIP